MWVFLSIIISHTPVYCVHQDARAKIFLKLSILPAHQLWKRVPHPYRPDSEKPPMQLKVIPLLLQFLFTFLHWILHCYTLNISVYPHLYLKLYIHTYTAKKKKLTDWHTNTSHVCIVFWQGDWLPSPSPQNTLISSRSHWSESGSPACPFSKSQLLDQLLLDRQIFSLTER